MTCLIVTVDTEEEGLWGGRYPIEDIRVQNLRYLPAFQELCDRYGVKPSYLLNTTVVEDRWAQDYFRELLRTHRAEVGTHVHPWNTPPLVPGTIPRDTFLCNLPSTLQRAKIAWLTKRIEDVLEVKPRSFRAGRYGAGDELLSILRELDYMIDSSVLPFVNYKAIGGPDYRKAKDYPYRARTRLLEEDATGDIWEIPISAGYNWDDQQAALWWNERLHAGWAKTMRLPGIFDRLGWLQFTKFSPEQADTQRLRKWMLILQRRQTAAAVMMFHSSSLMPGGSPYVQQAGGVEIILHRIEDCFHFAINELKWSAASLWGYYQRFLSAD